MSGFLCYVAFVLVSQIRPRQVEAVSSLAHDRVALVYKEASTHCEGITPSSHPATLEAADWACDEAFKALDDLGLNSCKGWRNAGCRVLNGLTQCSCIITSCGYYDVKSDVTKTFRQCAYKILIEELFTGEFLPSEGFQEAQKLIDEILEPKRTSPTVSNFRGSVRETIPLFGETSSKAVGPIDNRAPSSSANIFGAGEKKQLSNRFYCIFCKKPFTTKSNLRKHFKTKHPGIPPSEVNHGGEADHEPGEFRCDSCNRDYSTKGNLTKHHKVAHSKPGGPSKKTWAGTKNYVCIVCGEAFSREYILIEHQRNHPQKGDFVCHACDELNMGTKENLDRHNSIVHPTGPTVEAGPSSGRKRKLTLDYFCHICQQKLLDRFSLHRHVKRRHPGHEAEAYGRSPSSKPRTSSSG